MYSKQVFIRNSKGKCTRVYSTYVHVPVPFLGHLFFDKKFLFLLQLFITGMVIPEFHRTGPVQREVPGGGGRPEHHGQRWIHQRQVQKVVVFAAFLKGFDT
jgi:hypothetical protein